MNTERRLYEIAVKIERGTCDVDAVRSMFMLLREGAAETGLVREIGDCFGHPQRDRKPGPLYKLVLDLQKQIKTRTAGDHIVPKIMRLGLEQFRLEVYEEANKRHMSLSEAGYLKLAALTIASLQGSTFACDGSVATVTMAIDQKELHLAVGMSEINRGEELPQFALFSIPNVWRAPDWFAHHNPDGYNLLDLKFEGGELMMFQTPPKMLTLDFSSREKNKPAVRSSWASTISGPKLIFPRSCACDRNTSNRIKCRTLWFRRETWRRPSGDLGAGFGYSDISETNVHEMAKGDRLGKGDRSIGKRGQIYFRPPTSR